MAEITFSTEEREVICGKIQHYLQEELDQEVGQFEAGFLLDFFAEEIGPYFYNRGLYDARAILEGHLENIDEAIYGIEKPTQALRS
jgi:uncharacterized protein (DUF2164 family)